MTGTTPRTIGSQRNDVVTMQTLDADTLRAQVRRLVHFDTQRSELGLDLTVNAVFHITMGGRLDFGGSEFQPADREPLTPQRAHPDDEYGWWNLEAGTYIIRYNEALDLEAGQRVEVFPHERLLQAGVSHPAFTVQGAQDPLETLLTVGTSGCHLKENCRVSRLVGIAPIADH